MMMQLSHVLLARRDPTSGGQSLVEFALVLPILALLLFGVIQFGIIFGGYNSLINSVREAARYGSVCVGGPSTCGQATADYTGTKIQASGFAYASAANGQVEYQSYQEPATTGQWNIRMRVSGCVKTVLFIPLIGNIINPTLPSRFPMKSVETFRVEGNPSSAPVSGIPSDGTWGSPYTFGGGGC